MDSLLPKYFYYEQMAQEFNFPYKFPLFNERYLLMESDSIPRCPPPGLSSTSSKIIEDTGTLMTASSTYPASIARNSSTITLYRSRGSGDISPDFI